MVGPGRVRAALGVLAAVLAVGAVLGVGRLTVGAPAPGAANPAPSDRVVAALDAALALPPAALTRAADLLERPAPGRTDASDGMALAALVGAFTLAALGRWRPAASPHAVAWRTVGRSTRAPPPRAV